MMSRTPGRCAAGTGCSSAMARYAISARSTTTSASAAAIHGNRAPRAARHTLAGPAHQTMRAVSAMAAARRSALRARTPDVRLEPPRIHAVGNDTVGPRGGENENVWRRIALAILLQTDQTRQ